MSFDKRTTYQIKFEFKFNFSTFIWHWCVQLYGGVESTIDMVNRIGGRQEKSKRVHIKEPLSNISIIFKHLARLFRKENCLLIQIKYKFIWMYYVYYLLLVWTFKLHTSIYMTSFCCHCLDWNRIQTERWNAFIASSKFPLANNIVLCSIES